MNIRVNVETETWVTDEGDPPDVEWGDRESTDGRVVDVSVYATEEGTRESWYGEPVFDKVVQVGDTVYAVVVDYSTGDTFGRDGGYYQVLDVFTDQQDAINLQQLADEYTNGSRERQMDLLKYAGKEYYTSWIGYFEYTNDIAIWPCIVRDDRFKYGKR